LGRTYFNATYGNNGFGYDPVFFVPDYQCASAELSPEIKNSLSHRCIALKKLTDAIKARENLIGSSIALAMAYFLENS